jgi:tetratricopeptide (TPR) repeat protein
MRQLIGLYMTDKRWSLLEQTLKDGQKRFPNDPAYLMLEAQMWQMRNDTDRRLTAMEAGIHLSPNATPVILLYFNAMLETGRFERLLSAADSYSKDQALAPWPAIYRATALGKLKKYAEADAMFQKMTTSLLMQYMDPLARMIEQAYGLTDATARLETWAKAEPKAWQLQFILGRLYAHKGDTKKSLDAFLLGRELATQPGQKALVNRELGNAYYNMKQYPEAEKTFLAVLEIYPNDPQVLNNLGYMYAEDMNQPDKALPLVQKALEIYPNDQNVLDTYGWALFKQGKYNQAEEFLNRATSAGDTTPIIILHLATLKEQTGSNSEALKLYQQGFEMVRDDKNSTLYNQLKQGADRTENKLRSQK